MKAMKGLTAIAAALMLLGINSLALEQTVTGDLFDRVRFGANIGLDAIGPFREENKVDLQLATTWLNNQNDIDTQLRRQSLENAWSNGLVPQVITWAWMEHCYPAPQNESAYSLANLKRHRQDWLNDCRRLAERVKAPNDGRHLVLFCLETEFNNPTTGLGKEGQEAWVYWGQWMEDTRQAIKKIAPNALVGFSWGGWEAWGDPSRDGALSQALRDMDFNCFQSMWPILNQEEWIKDPASADAKQKARYEGTFGKKPHVWDYHIDEILLLAEKLHPYNPHFLISHYMLNAHLWGHPSAYNDYTLDQCSIDDAKNLFNDETMDKLRRLGFFGLSVMEAEDWDEYHTEQYPFDQWTVWGGDPWHNCGGALFLTGGKLKKPGYQTWVDGINHYSR